MPAVYTLLGTGGTLCTKHIVSHNCIHKDLYTKGSKGINQEPMLWLATSSNFSTKGLKTIFSFCDGASVFALRSVGVVVHVHSTNSAYILARSLFP